MWFTFYNPSIVGFWSLEQILDVYNARQIMIMIISSVIVCFMTVSKWKKEYHNLSNEDSRNPEDLDKFRVELYCEPFEPVKNDGDIIFMLCYNIIIIILSARCGHQEVTIQCDRRLILISLKISQIPYMEKKW